jgi:hypothetical protein
MGESIESPVEGEHWMSEPVGCRPAPTHGAIGYGGVAAVAKLAS